MVVCPQFHDATRDPFGVRTKLVSPRLQQFLTAFVAPKRSDGAQPVLARRGHVHAPVAHHRGARRIESVMRKHVGEELALVLVRAVQLAPMNRHEVPGEAEVAHDPLGIDMRFRRGDE